MVDYRLHKFPGVRGGGGEPYQSSALHYQSASGILLRIMQALIKSIKASPLFTFVMLVVALLGCRAHLSSEASSDSSKVPLADQMQQAVLMKQDVKEIRRILKAGFNVNDPIGCGTFNALDGAVAVHNMEMLNFLLAAGAQPKGSALLQAVWCRNPDISVQMVGVLLKAGADANYKDCYMGDPTRFTSPLHIACYQGYAEVVRLLLSQPGIELDTIDIDGYTPLMNAAGKGHKEIVGLLLAKGANPKVVNSRGQTAGNMAR